ncbi:hypothetical protein C8R46DRAFT_1049560 [Mycena filopes]|nr:hypothetical protein C8R46DRAFT_1049560 [Mycena filopes]
MLVPGAPAITDRPHSPRTALHRQDEILLDYESPAFLISEINGWTTNVQSAALVTTLFSGISAQLLGVIIADTSLTDKGSAASVDLLLFASYGAILSNVVATLVAVLIIRELGGIDARYREKYLGRSLGGPPTLEHPGSSLKLLQALGARRNLKYLVVQWIAFIFIQTLTYFWLREGHHIRVILTVLSGLAVVAAFCTAFCNFG